MQSETSLASQLLALPWLQQRGAEPLPAGLRPRSRESPSVGRGFKEVQAIQEHLAPGGPGWICGSGLVAWLVGMTPALGSTWLRPWGVPAVWGSGPRGLLSLAPLAPPFFSVSAGAQPQFSWGSGGPRTLCWGRAPPPNRRLSLLIGFSPVPPPMSLTSSVTRSRVKGRHTPAGPAPHRPTRSAGLKGPYLWCHPNKTMSKAEGCHLALASTSQRGGGAFVNCGWPGTHCLLLHLGCKCKHILLKPVQVTLTGFKNSLPPIYFTRGFPGGPSGKEAAC